MAPTGRPICPASRSRANIGQSYRLSTRATILPPGTGLSDRFSDFVGRTNVRLGRRLNVTHRFRLDKDNLAIRRNEIDATIGGRRTYATFGYLRLNRNIDPVIEDLRDREEIRVGGRVQFARYWSIFGSAIVDLTDRRRGSALARRRLRSDPPPDRRALRRRLHRAWRDLAARL